MGVVGTGALAGLLAAGLAVAVAGARLPSILVPASLRPFPDWLAGPLPGVGGVDPAAFALLVCAMCGCYLAVVACADAIRPGLALASVVVLHLAFALAPPLLSGDVFGYLVYARLEVLHGLSPYAHPAVAVPTDPLYPYVGIEDVASPYGPLFTLASYALVPLGAAAGVWTLKAIAAAASLGCVALLWSCARRLGRAPLPAALFVGLNPLLLVWGVGGGHNDLLTALLVLGGVYLALASREALGAGVLVAAAAVKASAGLVLPFLVLGARQSARALSGAVGATAILATISLVAFGADLLGHLEALARQAQSVSYFSVPSYFGRLLGLGGAGPELRLATAGAMVATVAGALVRVRRGGDWVTAAGWATLALVATATWLYPWYVVLPLVLAGLGRSRRLRFAALVTAAAIVAARLPLELASQA